MNTTQFAPQPNHPSRPAPSASNSPSSAKSDPARNPGPARQGGKDPIRVLVADDHPVVRWGLSACLAPYRHLQIVGEAADGQEALNKARELNPDIVLMDIEMPKMDGLTATEILRKELPRVCVLILTMHSQSDYLSPILRSGARGYILKSASPEELAKAIEAVHAGERYFSHDIACVALSQIFPRAAGGPQVRQLSNREREVLTAIAEGLSNKEIANHLNIGVRTAETHRERIMRKLNIHSVARLTTFAISKGLITLPKDL